jgi:RNA polymerase-binding transcription factor DksA
LRAQLEAQQASLSAQIARQGRLEGVGDTPADDPNTEVRGDQADQSVDLEAWDNSRQLALDFAAQLADVQLALKKMDAGTYGTCERCGRPIPLKRLRIIPSARFDVEHEAQAEPH